MASWTIWRIFFSVSGSKLPSYIIPIFPALALLIACYLQNASAKTLTWSAGFIALLGIAGLAYTPKIPGLTHVAFEQPLYQAYAVWVAVAAALSIIGSLVATVLARARWKDWSILTLGVTSFICMQVLMLGYEPLGTYAAGTRHLPALRAELTANTPLYTVGRYEQVLPFYLHRTMIPVAFADELSFGLEQQPELWLPTVDAFVRKWNADRAAGGKSVAIMSVPDYQALNKQGVPMRVIGQDPRRVIVANNP